MVEMATKVVYTLREDKQELQKQLGCMNGIFQLFDRRYLLGLHRNSRNQNKRLTPGEGENGEKEFKISSEKAKEKNPKNVMKEKSRASVESSRNSFSSSCSSTTFSSLDCSKRVQTEWQLPTEPTSPNLHKKQPDIRDVVKDSMTKEIRVKKDERVGNVMKHVDSPRPFIPQKYVQYDRKDQNLSKIHKISSMVKEVKEISRFSCDERESRYSLKSTFKVKELPRLSLDSKQNSNKNLINESKSEPGSNKRPSSGVVARLMGLESLTDSNHDVETLKIQPTFEECKHNHGSVSPRVHLKFKPQEDGERGLKKLALKNTKNAPAPSVYGEMEKRLSALEFKTSGNDLRALKQILEAMQMTKSVLDNKDPKTDQQGSPVIKRASSPKSRPVKPGQVARESLTITCRKQAKEPAPRSKKSTGGTPRSVSPVSSPRLQTSKNCVDKQCFHGPSSDSGRLKKQSNVVSRLKTRTPKIKPVNPVQNNEKSCRYTNNGDAVSYKLERNTNLAAQIKPKVTRNDQLKENHTNNFAERLIEDKPAVELEKINVEQPSPVSVLDAFYTEDTPSPVKKKANAFNDYENIHNDETEWNQAGTENLSNGTDTYQYSIKHTELSNSIDESVASLCTSTNIDHKYISEILLASGFLKDPDSAIRIVQLNPTASLIKPELLENQNDERDIKNTRYEKLKRKMIFDSVNDILLHKLVVSDSYGLCARRRPNGEKLLKEVLFEIDDFQSSSERCIYDEDDQVKKLVSADVNKNSEDWDKCRYEVPGVVLDMERLIFKDLIDEVVNADVASLQERRGRHCRRLFSM